MRILRQKLGTVLRFVVKPLSVRQQTAQLRRSRLV
jgi:hypothetical protein